MWTCLECRNKNRRNANFCQKCGAPRPKRNKSFDIKIFIIVFMALTVLILGFLIFKIWYDPSDDSYVPVENYSVQAPQPIPTAAPTPAPQFVWSQWSSWSSNPVSSSSTREVETRQSNAIVGYNMVHYGTQQAGEPYYRMFRDYSILGKFDSYGARHSYGEKHLTKYVTASQMDMARSFPADGNFIKLFYNGEDYEGFQMGQTTAYNFGDDNKVWFIESEVYSTVTEYRHRDLIQIQ